MFVNPDRKKRFLDEEYPNESTRKTYGSLLKQLSKFEQDKNKDLCDFSYSDAVEVMIGLRKKTYNSSYVAHSIIIKYVDWCEEKGYSQTYVNSFKLLDKNDLKSYTHQIARKNSYITRERLYEITNDLYNYVDKALLVLLFEGVRGRTEKENTFEELRNIKATDIIEEINSIIVTRNNEDQRVIQVDKRTIDILLASINEEEYFKKNGEATGRFAKFPLKSTPYILRTLDIERGDNGDDKISPTAINSKFKNIRSYLGLSFLNPTLVFQSGLLERCEAIEKQIGEPLEPIHFRQIFQELKLDDRQWFNLREMYLSFKENIAPK